jgi:hypothetical protein
MEPPFGELILDNVMLAARSYAATAGFGVFGGATIPASLIVSPSSRERNRSNDLGQLLYNLLQRMCTGSEP